MKDGILAFPDNAVPAMKIKSMIYASFWRIFSAISLLASISIVYTAWLSHGTRSGWHEYWGLYVLSGLQMFILALFASTYAWVVRSMRLEADAQRSAIDSAGMDSLTGASNRAVFLERLREALRREQPQQAGYLHIDMDNLKVVNDSFGHLVGDAALVHLVSTIRAMDPLAIIGRLGGDEFGVLLRETRSKEASIAFAQQLLDRFAKPTMIDCQLFELSASIGVVQAPMDGDTMEQLTANADLALYEGKQSGRRKVVPFEADMMIDEQHKRFIERELRGAILTGELEVHYQPIVLAETGGLSSYEALVRWKHSTRGMIGPAQFIPIAERGPLIDLLGEWVLARVCRDFPALDAPAVSVNISPAQLRRPYFAARFLSIVEQAGMTPDKLICEITETSHFEANRNEMQNVRALAAAGVKIWIDDFGAGHASLQYLKVVPFDCIKIDKSYAVNLGTDSVSAALVSAICGIGRSLNANVVAEGIETEQQRILLRAAGCTHMQGYHFGYPQPLPRILEGRRAAMAA